MSEKCPSCSSSRVEPAKIESAAIRLDRASTLKKVFNVGGEISCSVCLECGVLFGLRGDPAALAKALGT